MTVLSNDMEVKKKVDIPHKKSSWEENDPENVHQVKTEPCPGGKYFNVYQATLGFLSIEKAF